MALELRDPISASGEIGLRQTFARRALSYLDSKTGVLTKTEEFYFAMQHYGMYTRLLDWTESLGVAAYFAIRSAMASADKPNDAAIWVLDPMVMNEQCAELGYRMLSTDHVAVVRPYIPSVTPDADLAPVPEPPIALLAPSPTDRLTAQRSVFTLHGSLQIGLDEFEDCDQFLRKAVVPWDHVFDLARELRVVGMNETSVFPDLDGLGREMKMLTML